MPRSFGRTFRCAALIFALLLVAGRSDVLAAASPGQGAQPVTVLPTAVPKKCRKTPQILFDRCRDQVALFDQALKTARAEGKVLLVSYGADWCIWCHVFDAYVHGHSGIFRYALSDGPWEMAEMPTDTMLADAAALNTTFSRNFALVHIDADDRSNGFDVLAKTGAKAKYENSVPFNFVVNETGAFVGHIENGDVEVRRDGDDPFRGYDRAALLKQLATLYQNALPKAGSQ